ncbi:MAG: hypothetical protein ACE5JS_00605 [Nitrospinota bacterium]
MIVAGDYAAWIRRKLYTFSAGHATCAYLGYLKVYHYSHTAIRDPEIQTALLTAMTELPSMAAKRTIASAFAWYQTAKSVAGSLGKAAAGILLTLTATNFSVIFIVAFLLSVPPAFLVAGCERTGRSEDKEAIDTGPVAAAMPRGREAQEPSVEAGARPRILPFIGLGFLISSRAKMVHGLFPLLATEYANLSEAPKARACSPGFSTTIRVIACHQAMQ